MTSVNDGRLSGSLFQHCCMIWKIGSGHSSGCVRRCPSCTCDHVKGKGWMRLDDGKITHTCFLTSALLRAA